MPGRYPWLRWAVLAIGIALTLAAAHMFLRELDEETHSRFESMATDKALKLQARIRAYGDVLYALRGLFDASGQVSREGFHQFASALSIAERYPGFTNISYSFRVAHAEKGAFEQAVRAENSPLLRGLPPFEVQPPGARPEYVVLTYVDPLKPNLAGWGLDLTADPRRRSIVERARDSGELASGSGITLMRDKGNKSITSTLLRLAVYRGGGVPGSVEERQARFIGVVGSTLRLAEMVAAALPAQTLSGMRLRIFSAEGDAPEDLLYDSHAGGAQDVRWAHYAVRHDVPVADRVWRLEMTPLVDPTDTLDQASAAGLLVVGLALSTLLFWLTGSLATVELRRVELLQRNREAALLTSLGEDLHSCMSVEEAYAALTSNMSELLPGVGAVLYTLEPTRTRAAAAMQCGAPIGAAERFEASQCQAIRRGRAYYVGACQKEVDCGHFAGTPPGCYACVPLSAHGELTGMLHVQLAPEAVPGRREPELNIVKAIAQHLALAMANLGLREKLLEQATHDKLTGLYNRHYMHDWLEHELHRAGRHERPVGVIMLDIDHFKRINDSFGHEAGDAVLRELGALMRRLSRKSDVICRYGGEEFLLLMPEADAEATLRKAEELRVEFSRAAFSCHGQAFGGITLSCGVATYPRDGVVADVLLRRADEALYAAKQGGRNRSVLWAAVGGRAAQAALKRPAA